ncbi:MAG: hypothetical protein J7642_08430 [Cyanobacteria bacterium SBC]|nr:hypothetical protein [Cyanobacteria bacterium SBC]
MQTVNSPIVATVNPIEEKQRGQDFNLGVKVANRGYEKAQVDVWLSPRANDADSEALLEAWSDIDLTLKSIQIAPQKSHEFYFEFQIPTHAFAEIYYYDIFVYSPTYKRQQPLVLHQQLRVLASGDDLVPGLTVVPPMPRDRPLELPVSQPTTITVRVENVSKRVDRYFLACDLPEDWYHVVYTNHSNGLLLNPNRSGEINLVLHPPEDITSDLVYSPTLRLSSRVEGEILTDIIYFKVARFYGRENEGVRLEMNPSKVRLPRVEARLEDELMPVNDSSSQPQTLQSSKHWGKFEVDTINCSNTKRTVFVKTEFEKTKNCEQIFFDPEFDRVIEYPFPLELLPGKSKRFQPWVKPKVWKAPFRRREKEFKFFLQLVNVQEDRDYPLSDRQYSGTVTWKPSPWWVWFLLITSLLGVAAWVVLALFRLPAVPEIQVFQVKRNAESSQSEETPEGGVSLAWEIDKVDRIDSILLTYKDTSGQEQEQRFAFNTDDSESQKANLFSGQFWQFWNRKRSSRLILPDICQIPENIKNQVDCNLTISELDPTQGYTFELQVFSREARTLFGVRKRESTIATDVETTQTISFDAPRIEDLKIEEDSIDENLQAEIVHLNWQLFHLSEVTKAEITVRDQQGKTKVYRYTHLKNGNFEPESDAPQPQDSRSDNRDVTEESHPFGLYCNLEKTDGTELSELGRSFTKTEELESRETPEKSSPETPASCTWQTYAFVEPGIYRFEVAVFSNENPREAIDRQETQETVTLNEPNIQSFTATSKQYVAGEEVRVNWTIDNPHRVQTILMTRKAADGSDIEDFPPIQLPETPEYLFDNPPNACRGETNSNTLQLVCEALNVGAFPIGEYVFELTVVPRHAGGTRLTEQSRMVTIEPLRAGGAGGTRRADGAGGAGGIAGQGGAAGEDVMFAEENFELSIDGKPVGDDPVPFVFAIGESGAPKVVEIAWNVKAEGRNATVELLPIVGEVNPSGSFSYTLREAPFEITVTLQVTNELGEQAQRVAIIQAYRSNGLMGTEDESETLSDSPEERDSQPIDPHAQPGSLAPLEVPPQAN